MPPEMSMVLGDRVRFVTPVDVRTEQSTGESGDGRVPLMIALRRLALPFILPVVGACAEPPAEGIGAVGSRITAGAPDESVSAVWIVAKVGGRTGYCSGVVVSAHVVLTAAHCAPDAAQLTVFLGSDYNDPSQRAVPENRVTVAALHRHPDYDEALNLHDLAVLVTDAAIPRTPAVIARQPLTKSDIGAPIRVVGFGQASAADETIGRRRAATTTIAEIDDTGLAMKGTPSFCFFDSGGPTFMKQGDQEVVVGIHSIMESGTCDGTAWDGRVDVHAAFVDEMIANADPAPNDAGSSEASPGDVPAAAPSDGVRPNGGGCSASASPSGSGGTFAVVASLVALVMGGRRRRRAQARAR
jgi:MYXO-CTERM domain-containing protein